MTVVLSVRQSRALGLALALVVLALDLASKTWAAAALQDGPVAVLPFLNLALTWNYGISFGTLNAGQVPPWAWLALALAMSGALGVWLWRGPAALTRAALGLVIGGALGNGIDRVRFGAVADFIDVHAGGWHFWVFNLADSGITVGAVLLVADSLFRRAE